MPRRVDLPCLSPTKRFAHASSFSHEPSASSLPTYSLASRLLEVAHPDVSNGPYPAGRRHLLWLLEIMTPSTDLLL